MRLVMISVLIWLLLFAVVSFTPSPASALDVEVTTCTRNGLADAITAAGAGGTVTFDCDPNDPIVFPSAAPIPIVFNVTINGSVGTERIVLDGDNASSFFIVDNSATLVIQDLILQNGHNASGGGGAIRVEVGATLDVSNSGFLFNTTDVAGGAINSDGPVNIMLTSFISNSADSGGAIYAYGPLTISKSSFQQNKAVEGSAEGGAIFSGGVTTNISLSYFAWNSATFGGALRTNANVVSTTTTIDRSTFYQNHASDHGGAIDVSDGVMNISASTFSENTSDDLADGGSAIYMGLDAQSNTISFSTFVQPADTSPAIGLEGGLTVIAVLLGGEGAHCSLVGFGAPGGYAILTDSYTLSNETSCGLKGTGSDQTITDVKLGSLTSAVVNGVSRTYYPLLEGSPAINAGPETCDGLDQLDAERPFGPACDVGAVEFLENSAPTISQISTTPTYPIEGTDTEVVVFASDVDFETLTYSFDCNNDDIWEVEDQDSNSYTCVYPDNGNYFIEVEVSDSENTASQTRSIAVTNAVPTITSFAASPSSVQVNETVTLSATATDVPDDTVTITYSCDGTLYDSSTTCSFDTGGTHTVWVKAADEDDGTSVRSLNVFVNALPAITGIGANPSDPVEGESVTITVTATDADADNLTYWIDCGEDDNDDWELSQSTANSTSCVYPDNGDFTISVKVSDGGGDTIQTASITVLNQPPTVGQLVASPAIAQLNETVTLTVTASDVSADEPLTITFSCEGGTLSNGNECSYSSPGKYTAKVTVDDNDGGVVTRETEIFVNAPPWIAGVRVSTSAPGAVEGNPVTLTLIAGDSDGDELTYSFDCTNDGVWEVENQESDAYDCIFPDNGGYTTRLRVSDGGASTDMYKSIGIGNLPPVISSFTASPNPGVVGELVTLSALATDVPADTVTYAYSCGDGVQVNATQCRFDRGGTYHVSVIARDEDQGSVDKQLTVRIFLPSTLCANQWNGALRMIADDGQCNRDENLIQLPANGPVNLCVNQWNGAARASDFCSRSEYQLTATGEGSIPVCVNIWNGVLRVSDYCSRSEYADLL